MSTEFISIFKIEVLKFISFLKVEIIFRPYFRDARKTLFEANTYR